MSSPDNLIPFENELPSNFADRLGVLYSATVTNEYKKENGQFFTPTAIAQLMASYCKNQNETVTILDPGCGTGILTGALIEHLALNNKNLKEIELTAYETDLNLIAVSEKALSYLKSWLTKHKIALTYILHVTDFIIDNAEHLGETLHSHTISKRQFDVIISNPPYFKLSKDDSRTKAARVVISGQPNIYSIFMAIAAKLLTDDGELIFITPRSFASGNYFKTFREFFFQTITIENIHLFVSRKDTFTRDNVLQETVIIKGSRHKKKATQNLINISSSVGLKDLEHPISKIYRSDELIDFKTKEKMLHLPTTDLEEQVIHLFKSWSGNLHKYHIQISTGPVVSFRSWDFIHSEYENGTVYLAPLYWLHNVNKMSLEWPIPKPNKGQYISIMDESKSILIPNKDYIFLRRFSSKDDKSRLIAAPYFRNLNQAEYIGVENKVNYIYRPKGHLERSEIVGLCALLNSNLFDAYFRTFNGNVNVSATELREISLPPLDTIKDLGTKIILTNDFSMKNINESVNEIFELNHALAI